MISTSSNENSRHIRPRPSSLTTVRPLPATSGGRLLLGRPEITPRAEFYVRPIRPGRCISGFCGERASGRGRSQLLLAERNVNSSPRGRQVDGAEPGFGFRCGCISSEAIIFRFRSHSGLFNLTCGIKVSLAVISIT